MLEIAIALIIGFALGYGVRAWIFPTPSSLIQGPPMPDHQNRIMIYGPKTDGTYVIEFRTAGGEALAISIPRTETAVIRHFQERMPYGLFVPDLDAG